MSEQHRGTQTSELEAGEKTLPFLDLIGENNKTLLNNLYVLGPDNKIYLDNNIIEELWRIYTKRLGFRPDDPVVNYKNVLRMLGGDSVNASVFEKLKIFLACLPSPDISLIPSSKAPSTPSSSITPKEEFK